jgi:hypothetical protein
MQDGRRSRSQSLKARELAPSAPTACRAPLFARSIQKYKK